MECLKSWGLMQPAEEWVLTESKFNIRIRVWLSAITQPDSMSSTGTETCYMISTNSNMF